MSEFNNENENRESVNFIQKIINEDLEKGTYGNRVHTRFPPEPNGFLHVGHAKSICLNYGLAKKNNGIFNLRFDDTNPTKEDDIFIESIIKDVKWLCPDWEERIFYASNYFGKMYDYAVELIKKGLAFVDDLSADEIREYRGTLTEPGKESPYRNRTVEENLELFEKMKNGVFKDGEKVLRAKIDMASPNINMRDPVIYRILHESHYNTGDEWCIYPMYDFAHPLEDAIEGITHSICTLEFEDHRPFYDWVLSNIDDFKDAPTKQIEFAKLFLSKTMMGKRYLKQMVEEGYVDGWDDPRMPTIAGFRRRGYTPEAIHNFCEAIGVSKAQSVVDIAMLEFAIRDDLGPKVPRTMAVLDPIKLIITNYPEDKVEYVETENNPDNPDMGSRMIPFTREVYIEREDFMENPPKKYFRLFPGNEVRLRNAYFVKCVDFVKDEDGNVTEVHCTYDPETKSGSGFTGRKVKGTLHWVSAKHCIDAEVRLYDYMMEDEEYDKTNFLEKLNPESKVVLKNCKVEPSMKEFKVGDRFQFLRHGYFIIDQDTTEDNLVFNRIVSLKSSFKGV
ncbi:MAG TPA: glutamine--tRNA ligase/YqeY domain fusion protein [Sedimentibacter sp.]|jgi:glutaminyl-tRNA synthetase|nr:glutamine--tRNA ligase/YqeY domain fusion protein [Sedimentibacter sp.]HOG63297.1 glutamine--tRNA ligase/YqeY domain fusion protein [Sedimentibacter sp.]HOT20956.1 glutamine--tRNA ligase/YqeY domain fusion protein [Sedimentibacter sp.]HPB79041.1 glutamine--tRNA ligase/YqeY domain fusion protein [Sedimentibacter sp.]HPV85393.1 glutamine--tRNA ligase/YqeY domain fusion protein [Sedimentibacter sp.]